MYKECFVQLKVQLKPASEILCPFGRVHKQFEVTWQIPNTSCDSPAGIPAWKVNVTKSAGFRHAGRLRLVFLGKQLETVLFSMKQAPSV